MISFCRIIYWSDIGSKPNKIMKASMDGSDIRIVAFLNNANDYTFLFTLDYSQQILYWIKSSNSSSCNINNTDYLESSRVDGSKRRIVVRPLDCYYHGSQAIDSFGGVIYSYSRHSRKIFKTVAESVSNITSFSYINHFMGCNSFGPRYGCMCNSQTGIKVISLERQPQGSCMHVRPVTIILCIQAISR